MAGTRLCTKAHNKWFALINYVNRNHITRPWTSSVANVCDYMTSAFIVFPSPNNENENLKIK